MNIDENFYGKTNSFKLSELIETIKNTFPELYHSNIVEKDITLENCSTIEKATKKDLVFIENPKYINYLDDCKAGCVILDPQHLSHVNKNNPFPTPVYLFHFHSFHAHHSLPGQQHSVHTNS